LGGMGYAQVIAAPRCCERGDFALGYCVRYVTMPNAAYWWLQGQQEGLAHCAGRKYLYSLLLSRLRVDASPSSAREVPFPPTDLRTFSSGLWKVAGTMRFCLTNQRACVLGPTAVRSLSPSSVEMVGPQLWSTVLCWSPSGTSQARACLLAIAMRCSLYAKDGQAAEPVGGRGWLHRLHMVRDVCLSGRPCERGPMPWHHAVTV